MSDDQDAEVTFTKEQVEELVNSAKEEMISVTKKAVADAVSKLLDSLAESFENRSVFEIETNSLDFQKGAEVALCKAASKVRETALEFREGIESED